MRLHIGRLVLGSHDSGGVVRDGIAGHSGGCCCQGGSSCQGHPVHAGSLGGRWYLDFGNLLALSTMISLASPRTRVYPGRHFQMGSRRISAVTQRQQTGYVLTGTQQARRRLLQQGLLCVIYIMCDISVYLVGDRATQAYNKQSVIITGAAVSVVLGTLISASHRGSQAAKESLNVRSILALLPVSLGFGLSSLSLLQTFRYFDAAFVKLLGQMKLPFTALFTTLFLSRSYSLKQWHMILMICTACSSFMVLKMGGSIRVGTMSWVGLCCIGSWIICNVLATLVIERVFQRSPKLSFSALMTRLEAGKLISIAMLWFFTPGVTLAAFYKGWDFTTFLVLACVIGDEWLSGLMVKQLSSVAKSASKCVSLAALYAVALATGRQPADLLHVLGAVMIVQTTALFGMDVALQNAEVQIEGDTRTA